MAGRSKKDAVSEQAWGHARSLWITTNLPTTRIAEEIGVTEGAVRIRAKREAWGPRNAPEQKRALVASAAAGITKSITTIVPRTEAEKAISAAADEDIADMALALSVGRKLLLRCAELLDMTAEGEDGPIAALGPKDLNQVAGTWRSAVDGIRKIRGLDEPNSGKGGEEDSLPSTVSALADRLDRFIEQA